MTFNLQREGFTTGSIENSLMPVELDGRSFCLVLDTGGIRYRREDVADDSRSAALDKVISITRATAEYMRQMETAPKLTASGLEGDYRLLADFNNMILAGHPTGYGVQFITWERVQGGTALHQGHYYGPNAGVDSYTAARQDFATRSGLVPYGALFTPEQLAEIYRCIHETLDSGYPITEDRQKCLESAAEQIERMVPDLDARVALSNTKEQDLADMTFTESDGPQFC